MQKLIKPMIYSCKIHFFKFPMFWIIYPRQDNGSLIINPTQIKQNMKVFKKFLEVLWHGRPMHKFKQHFTPK